MNTRVKCFQKLWWQCESLTQIRIPVFIDLQLENIFWCLMAVSLALWLKSLGQKWSDSILSSETSHMSHPRLFAYAVLLEDRQRLDIPSKSSVFLSPCSTYVRQSYSWYRSANTGLVNHWDIDINLHYVKGIIYLGVCIMPPWGLP